MTEHKVLDIRDFIKKVRGVNIIVSDELLKNLPPLEEFSKNVELLFHRVKGDTVAFMMKCSSTEISEIIRNVWVYGSDKLVIPIPTEEGEFRISAIGLIPHPKSPMVLYYITNSKKKKRIICGILYSDNVETKVFDVSKEKVFNVNNLILFAVFYNKLLSPIINFVEFQFLGRLCGFRVHVDSKSINGRVYDIIKVSCRDCKPVIRVVVKGSVTKEKPYGDGFMKDDEIDALSFGLALYFWLVKNDYCDVDKSITLIANEKKAIVFDPGTDTSNEYKVDEWSSLDYEEFWSLINE